MSEAHVINEKLMELTGIILSMDDHARRGAVPESAALKAMEEEIHRICVQIESTPRDVAEAVQPQMAQMIVAVEELANALRNK